MLLIVTFGLVHATMSHCHTLNTKRQFWAFKPASSQSQNLGLQVPQHNCRGKSFHHHRRQLTSLKALAKGGAVENEQKKAKRKEKERGRSTYSPQSYKELLGDAVQSIEYALEDGVKRMEVDFPTLSGDSEPFQLQHISF